MSSYEYRIEYSIKRAPEDTDDWEEVGFGVGGGSSIAGALHELVSNVENRQWETEPGMPKPDELEGDDQ